MKTRNILIVIFILFVFMNVNTYSSTGRDVEVDCPLCDTVVSYWAQMSYSIFTYGLDLKPLGAARIPQPIPRCEKCGFVFIEDYFTDEEILKLKNHIINKNIFSGIENFPKYYYLGRELELLDNDRHDDLVYFYICAVWEYSFNKMAVEYFKEKNIENVQGIQFDNTMYLFLMQNAVEKINTLNRDYEEYDNLQLIKLDFLRRQGLFDEAKKIIENIKNNRDFYQDFIVDLIAYQIELIDKKDTEEHSFDEFMKE